MNNNQNSDPSDDKSNQGAPDSNLKGSDSELTPKRDDSPRQDRDGIGLPRPGLARHNAPETSIWAAMRATKFTGPHRVKILAAIRAAGPEGLSDDEGETLLGIKPQSYTPRRGELAKAGLIAFLPGQYRLTSGNSPARVWVAVEHQAEGVENVDANELEAKAEAKTEGGAA